MARFRIQSPVQLSSPQSLQHTQSIQYNTTPVHAQRRNLPQIPNTNNHHSIQPQSRRNVMPASAQCGPHTRSMGDISATSPGIARERQKRVKHYNITDCTQCEALSRRTLLHRCSMRQMIAGGWDGRCERKKQKREREKERIGTARTRKLDRGDLF